MNCLLGIAVGTLQYGEDETTDFARFVPILECKLKYF